MLDFSLFYEVCIRPLRVLLCVGGASSFVGGSVNMVANGGGVGATTNGGAYPGGVGGLLLLCFFSVFFLSSSRNAGYFGP